MRGTPGWVRRVFLCLLLSALCGGRQLYETRPPNPNQPRHPISGTVINAVTGEPVNHALVQIWGGASERALTGTDGRFQLDNVPEGSVSISITKPGYFDARSAGGSVGQESNQAYAVGSGNNDFQLKLYPAAKIVGRVTDSDGEPVEETQIQVLNERIVQGRKVIDNGGMKQTDGDGMYRVDDLVPGRYIVYSAGHMATSSDWGARQAVSTLSYYPEASDLAAAQRIVLRAGEEYRADFHLKAGPGFRVAGTLSGYPAGAGVSLMVQNATGQQLFMNSLQIDPNKGQFALQAVPPGTWTIVLTGGDREGHSFQARQEVTVGGSDIDNLQVQLHAAASIPVTVNHTAEPQQFETNGQRMSVSMHPGFNALLTSAEPNQFQQVGMMWNDADAHPAFKNVAEGRYKLQVQSFGTECVESAWYGNVDLMRDYLVVGPDGGTQTININMRSDCATVGAKVASGEKAGLAFALLALSSSVMEPQVLTINSAVPTQFSVNTTVSPGTYQVYGFTTLDELEYTNPEVLREYPSQTVELAPGQKAELTVKLSEPKAQ